MVWCTNPNHPDCRSRAKPLPAPDGWVTLWPPPDRDRPTDAEIRAALENDGDLQQLYGVRIPDNPRIRF